MSILKHPLLRSLSALIEQEKTVFKWIDLYAAQFIADSFSKTNLNDVTGIPSNGIADLFDTVYESKSSITEADIIVLALMCSQRVSQGKTHLNLSELPHELMTSAKACGYKPSYSSKQTLLDGLNRLDELSVLRVVSCDGSLDENSMPLDDALNMNQSPLILFKDKLFLAKYWSLHQAFEIWLRSRSNYVEHLENSVLEDLSLVLKRVFPNGNSSEEVNWQAVAAAHTLLNPFSLITGGPGTGKTTTAASLLFLLMYKHQQQLSMCSQTNSEAKKTCLPLEKLHVRLLAPTGKAAVKLADSIRYQLKQIEARLLGNDLKCLKMSDCLPETGETVHRFLYEMGGLRDEFHRPKRFKTDDILLKRSEQNNANEKLEHHTMHKKPLDVVIVDESSMMDLALMVELISLIPPTTQLILLGDHYQLPAVDPGQVFTECVERFLKQCQGPEEINSLSILTGYSKKQLTVFDSPDAKQGDLGFQPLCSLRKTYRFDGELKIAADQIKAGEVHDFKKQFWCASEQRTPNSSVTWYDSALSETPDYFNMVKPYTGYFDLIAKGASLAELVAQFERYQLLCSTLEGPQGAHFINSYIEQHFHSACFPNGKYAGELYHGKAILVTRNHPHLGVYNGDIGFVMKDENTVNLNVHFPISDDEAIVVPPARIKEWQTAYAMTVHKSQGSEYERVGVVLADYAKELLSRALLYTALTRSKKHCDIWVSGEALTRAFEV